MGRCLGLLGSRHSGPHSAPLPSHCSIQTGVQPASQPGSQRPAASHLNSTICATGSSHFSVKKPSGCCRASASARISRRATPSSRWKPASASARQPVCGQGLRAGLRPHVGRSLELCCGGAVLWPHQRRLQRPACCSYARLEPPPHAGCMAAQCKAKGFWRRASLLPPLCTSCCGVGGRTSKPGCAKGCPATPAHAGHPPGSSASGGHWLGPCMGEGGRGSPGARSTPSVKLSCRL